MILLLPFVLVWYGIMCMMMVIAAALCFAYLCVVWSAAAVMLVFRGVSNIAVRRQEKKQEEL